MIQIKKTILTLVALFAMTTGAWATEFTSLKVGDVLHVGDVINTGTNYMVCDGSLDASFQPATVVRGDIVIGTRDVTESETGAYYLLKTQIGVYAGVISGPLGNEGGSWPVTDTSDGISVTAIAPADYGYTELTFAVHEGSASSGPEVAWDKAKNSGTFKMPGGNVTLEPEYYPQAALAAAPTAINDVPATTDGAIVEAGTVANIGETTTAQGTVMYYVSPSPLTDAALQALAADQWTADVPTAAGLAQGQAYVYYYVRGNDSDNDDEIFSDGDIKALTVTLAAAPLWNAEFDLTNAPEEDKAGKWSTDIPEGGVVKGTEVTVTYSGTKKVIGVKAEKKAAAPASTPLDNTIKAWTAGTYVVPAGGLTYSDAITVSGDVTLTLTDGETLTLNKGISLAEGATLTVEGTGTMNVNGTNGNSSSTIAGSGMMCFKSGTLVATGGNGHVGNDLGQFGMNGGISHGGSAINGSLTLEGGNVTATGGNGGNAGGASSINWATGGNGGSAITGNVIINGGNWTANNGSNGTLLSGGSNNVAGTGGKAVAGTVTDNR